MSKPDDTPEWMRHYNKEQERVDERLVTGSNGVRAIDMRLASEVQVGGSHYKDMPIQPSEYIYENGLNWLEGNAIKYITRHALKGGAKDIDKAIHYLELLKEMEYGEA